MTNLNLGCTRRIINEARDRSVLRNQLAYILATAFWETARTMKPVREYGGETYLRGKRYYPYVGMGLVQLTWKANYKKASRKLGVDFVSEPKLLLEERYAVPILVVGMIEGWFTGKSLSDYLTLSQSNFKGARRIINGTDKDDEIAAIARDYDEALLRVGYGVEVPVEEPKPEPVVIEKPVLKREAKKVLDDADKPALRSTTNWSAIGGMLTNAATALATLDPIPATLIIAVGTAFGGYIIWERTRKAREAREAKVAA